MNVKITCCLAFLFIFSKVLLTQDLDPWVYNQPGSRIEVLIIKSILENKTGKIAESLRSMKEAVECAQHNGWMQHFIEHGAEAIPIIEELSKKSKNSVYC